MVLRVNLWEEHLGVPRLPIVEPKIEMHSQFFFFDAALGDRAKDWNHIATFAVRVAGQYMNEVRESADVVSVDDGKDVGHIDEWVHRVELCHRAMDVVADAVVGRVLP